MATRKSTGGASGKAYYMISAVAQKYNIHPQTLRLYEREGLLKPSRKDGNTRLYSDEDLQRLETILSLTRDLQRSTRFSYFRCVRGHGRFTPFMQFLLEKNFVRPLPPAEIERLKRAVGTVRCSGCGAGIDLAADTACRYCRAPIAVLDPDALSRTVEALTTAEARRNQIDPEALAEGILAAERLGRTLSADARPGRAGDAIVAAIALGASALDLLFSSRR